jgi:hypothetical protein
LSSSPTISADVLYFYANLLPADVKREEEHHEVEAAYQAFRKGARSEEAGEKGKVSLPLGALRTESLYDLDEPNLINDNFLDKIELATG